ncbi:hypothetical protein [Paenibacillus oceani]|uniref:Lipoprotein n=1 Tax=Paenibacillus oceani TaxID=2772510 RepID=A0A927CDN1_9BACL|nr:hypothetical protein [Paenibacillus oceani]MBD2865695.1 hypothetical protein [Paenibacillus oceani]
MRNKIWKSAGISIMAAMLAGACSPTALTDPTPSQQSRETSKPSSVQASGKENMPEYLPADFPLPKDAEIETSHSGINDGRKSALLVFTTKESMSSVTKLYKDYFKTQNLADAAQTIDDKNIIIQGENKTKKQSWSMIGGVLASKDGVIELTVTWSEL